MRTSMKNAFAKFKVNLQCAKNDSLWLMSETKV